MNWLLALILVILVLQSVVFLAITLRIRGFLREIAGLLVSPDGKSPPPLSLLFDSLAGRFIDRAKVSLMGMVSGQARGEQAVMAEMVEQGVSARSPLLGAVLAAFPKSRKILMKNPGLLEFAMAKFMPGAGPGAAAAAPGPDHGGQGFAANPNRYG